MKSITHSHQCQTSLNAPARKKSILNLLKACISKCILRSIAVANKLLHIICPCEKHANITFQWLSGKNTISSRNIYFERDNLLTNYCFLRVEYVKKYPQLVKEDIPKLMLAASACKQLIEDSKQYLVPYERAKEFTDIYLNLVK